MKTSLGLGPVGGDGAARLRVEAARRISVLKYILNEILVRLLEVAESCDIWLEDIRKSLYVSPQAEMPDFITQWQDPSQLTKTSAKAYAQRRIIVRIISKTGVIGKTHDSIGFSSS